jgi:hypothetical protein
LWKKEASVPGERGELLILEERAKSLTSFIERGQAEGTDTTNTTVAARRRRPERLPRPRGARCSVHVDARDEHVIWTLPREQPSECVILSHELFARF